MNTTSRKATDKVLQAGLDRNEYNYFKEVAIKKDWSDKKLTEKIIKLFLSELKLNPNRINDL